MSRRQLLGGGTAALACACASETQRENTQAQVIEPSTEEFVIRRGYVATMDEALGDFPTADVYINQGIIYQVGVDLQVPSTAREIDASHKVVLPGFVDTHSHLWLTQMRGLFGQDAGSKYFPLVRQLGRAYTPDDMAVGTELGALECLNAGITTVSAYCDNIRGPEHADAALDALAKSRIRHRFIYGPHDDMSAEQPVDLTHVTKLREANPSDDPSVLRSFALGVRLPRSDKYHVSIERARREILIARSMKLPISGHASGPHGPAQLAFLLEQELLGEDLQIVHATGAEPEQLAQLEMAGVAVTLTPISEQRVGFGLTRLSDYDPHLSRLGLGCDGNALSGAADMFAVMKTLHSVDVASTKQELSTLPRRMLELATAGGAAALGQGHRIGSLVPGKRADVMLVDMRDFNTVWSRQGDPAALLVYSAGPHNVDAVWVDGRIVKFDGKLIDVDEQGLFARAEASIWGVRERAQAAP